MNILSLLTSKQIEDEGICKVCKGNAKYMERVENDDGTISEVWHFCEACEGTGREGGDGDVD